MGDVDTAIAEGAHGDLWLVAYAAPCGAVDVLAYRYRRAAATVAPRGAPITAGVDLGACAWSGRLRAGARVSTVGEPGARALAMAAVWVAREVERG